MQTWDKLTADQLVAGAADLRNAALVVKHAGHFKGALCDEDSGMVCIVGAIDLATYRRMVHAKTTSGFYALPQSEHIDTGAYRAENAIIIMASYVPTGLCDDCDDEQIIAGHGGDCICGRREAWETVTHYNDNHCTSGIVAQNMLTLAAAGAELLAEQKREMVPA